MKKILIFGGTGMLGHQLASVMNDEECFDVHVVVRAHSNTSKIKASSVHLLSIFSEFTVLELINKVEPDYMINCVGHIKQRADGEGHEAVYVNSYFPHLLAHFSTELGIKLINISTDCVFSGKRGNYRETDTPDATDFYGRTKALGEVTGKQGVLTLRTSIIGPELANYASLLEWFLNQKNQEIQGFTNAYFSGQTTLHLSQIIRQLCTTDNFASGLVQIGSDRISKFDLLTLINEIFRCNITIIPNHDFKIDRSLVVRDEISGIITRKCWREQISELHELYLDWSDVNEKRISG